MNVRLRLIVVVIVALVACTECKKKRTVSDCFPYSPEILSKRSADAVAPTVHLRERQQQPPPEENRLVFQDMYESIPRELLGTGKHPWVQASEALAVTCSVINATVWHVAQERKVVRILDAPQGDWSWMPGCLLKISNSLPFGSSLSYQGLDVAPLAVQVAKERAAKISLPRVHVAEFLEVDMTKPGVMKKLFGEQAFDIVVCNKALQHIPNAGIRSALANFIDVAKYLITDDSSKAENVDITVGDIRTLSLQERPFSFKPTCSSSHSSSIQAQRVVTFQLPLQVKAEIV